MATLLYAEVNVFCIVILCIVACNAASSGFEMRPVAHLFVISIWFAAISNVFELLWNLGSAAQLPISSLGLTIVNFLYFMTFGLSCFSWFLYAEAFLGDRLFKNKPLFIASTLPLVLLAALLVRSAFDGCLFYFDENGIYHRGPLFYMQQILSYGYIAFTSCKTLISAMHKKNYALRDDFLLLASFAISPLIAAPFQAVYQNIPILPVGVTVSFLLVYVNSLKTLISMDPLTGIPNRRQLLRHLSSEVRTLEENERLYFMFIDIDSFKQINDTYGHNEGDRALMMTASVLKAVCEKYGGFCARYGGDEFAIVHVMDQNADIAFFCDRISKELKRRNEKEAMAYTVEASIGYAEYTADLDNIQALIYSADYAMYQIKKTHGPKKLSKH